MEFQFNQLGNISPNKIIEINWPTLNEVFDENFSNSSTRRQLLTNLEQFILQIENEITGELKIWINGSFISQKINPRDIDAVFWLPHQIAEHKKSILDNQFFTKQVKISLNLDLYYAIDYPKNHKKYFLTHLDALYWKDVYGHTRQDSNGVQHQKGFFELKINSKWKN
jgi:hypothetical protein